MTSIVLVIKFIQARLAKKRCASKTVVESSITFIATAIQQIKVELTIEAFRLIATQTISEFSRTNVASRILKEVSIFT